MVLVYLKNGDCIELMAAVATEQDESTLTCVNVHGDAVATFELATVARHTSDALVAEEMKEEVCEDLTVLPA